MPKVKAALLALMLILLTASIAAAGPQRHKLPNGMTVITAENHESPVVAVQVWVRAGAAYEEPHEYGITHLIEHMIFKGTPSRPAGQMARQIEALGGQVNAYTTLDHTNYYVVTASQNAGQALDILADAVANASFDAAELAREKEVVVEEIRMNQDNPSRRRTRALLAASFGKDHPYGRPVLGTEKSVRAISRQDILNYRAKWYRGPGMVVVAVGDFKTAEMLPRIKKAFAGVSAQKPPAFTIAPVKTGQGPRLVVLREDVRQAALAAAWVIPGLPSPEVFPLDMAATVLGDGRTSRLYEQLKYKAGLADGISSSAYTPRTVGLLTAEASLKPENVQAAWPELLRVGQSLISRPPQAGELKRARINLAASFIRERQTMAGQASTLGYFEMMRGGYEKAADYMRDFSAVGAGQVAEAAQKYMRPSNLTMVIQVPKDAAVPDQVALAQKAGDIYAQLCAAAATDRDKPFKTVLPNGLTVIIKPARAVPLVSVVLAGPGGQSAETPATAGVYKLWSNTITRGAAGRSFLEISATLEDMAASISGFSGKGSAGISGGFLSQDWQQGLELMTNIWFKPDFPEAEVAKAKAEQAAALRAQMDQPWIRAFDAFRPLLYGKHPYAMNSLGSVQSLALLNRGSLLATHEKLRGPGGLVLTIVGDVDSRAALDRVKELWGSQTGKVQAVEAAGVPPLAKPQMAAIKDPKVQQTQIILGFIAPDSTDPRRFALNILEAVLGGQGGRLFRDLRDERSLAYAVQPFYTEAWHVGAFGFYMAVGPGKEKEAVGGLEEHINRVTKTDLSAEEMERAKAYLLGSRAISLQTYSAQAMVITMDELTGLGWQDYLKTPERIKAVTAEQVRRVAEEFLAFQHMARLTLGR